MDLGRLSNGERISSISAILLFISMFFHWFGAKTVNTSSLLIAFQGFEPEKNAWQALDYIPFVLLVTISVTLVVAALRTIPEAQLPVSVNGLTAILGCASALLIIFRIVDPPIFYAEGTFTIEGTVQFPMFLALPAAVGITTGGLLALREEGVSFAGLRARRGERGR